VHVEADAASWGVHVEAGPRGENLPRPGGAVTALDAAFLLPLAPALQRLLEEARLDAASWACTSRPTRAPSSRRAGRARRGRRERRPRGENLPRPGGAATALESVFPPHPTAALQRPVEEARRPRGSTRRADQRHVEADASVVLAAEIFPGLAAR
jgi:hypothetical protein